MPSTCYFVCLFFNNHHFEGWCFSVWPSVPGRTALLHPRATAIPSAHSQQQSHIPPSKQAKKKCSVIPLYGHTPVPPPPPSPSNGTRNKPHLFSLQTAGATVPKKCNPRPLRPDPHSAATTPGRSANRHFPLMCSQD